MINNNHNHHHHDDDEEEISLELTVPKGSDSDDGTEPIDAGDNDNDVVTRKTAAASLARWLVPGAILAIIFLAIFAAVWCVGRRVGTRGYRPVLGDEGLPPN